MVKRFNPGVPLTITVIICLAILLALGTWQARKIGPKTDLLDRIHTGLSAAPIDLPLTVSDVTALEYTRVRVEGWVLETAPLKMFGTNLRGKSGYHLYLPVQVTSELYVMANIGWMPMAMESFPTLPLGRQKLTGVLLSSAKPGTMSLPNNPEKDEWFLADVDQMSADFENVEGRVYPLRLIVDDMGEAGELPIGGQVRVNIPNDHLEYALTWYGIALGLIGVYVLFGFRRNR